MTCIDLHVAVDRVGMFDVDVSGAVPSTMGLGNLALASVKKPRYLPQASNVRRGDGFPCPEDRTRRTSEFLHFMAARERIESRVELAKGDLDHLPWVARARGTVGWQMRLGPGVLGAMH